MFMKKISYIILILVVCLIGYREVNARTEVNLVGQAQTLNIGVYTLTTDRFDSFCEEEGVKNSMKFIGNLLFIAKVVVPILLVVFGTIDFSKAVVAGDGGEITKTAKRFAFRFISGIVIFLLPTMINFVFDEILKMETDYTKCRTCILKPSGC